MYFTDKTVVITGAGAGIGRAIAEAFAAEGAYVIVTDIDLEGIEETAKIIHSTGGKAIAIKTNVTDEAAVSEMVTKTLEATGRIDVLINNAGLHLGDYDLCTDLAVAEWRKIIDVNLIGALICAKACRAALAQQPESIIINQSSMAAHIGLGAYAVSKAALDSLTQMLAKDLSPAGTRVMGIAPGLVNSPTALKKMPRELTERVIAMQLVKRSGLMQDLVNTALFLASDKSSFMSGQTVLVDGGAVAAAGV
jgi:3-oxoacyl-[acyl-carrier protein] reductase